MLPTHLLAGILLALPVAVGFPEVGLEAVLAGALGGLVPDLDLYYGHRKTLHYPVGYLVAAVPAVGVAILAPTALTIGLALFLLAAAAHSIGDILGGGLELRPWEGTDQRAVYNHLTGRWLAPRRVIRYDGAPEDLLLSVGLSLPALIAFNGLARLIVLLTLGIALIYVGVRRHLARLAPIIVGTLPPVLHGYVPARYLDSS